MQEDILQEVLATGANETASMVAKAVGAAGGGDGGASATPASPLSKMDSQSVLDPSRYDAVLATELDLLRQRIGEYEQALKEQGDRVASEVEEIKKKYASEIAFSNEHPIEGLPGLLEYLNAAGEPLAETAELGSEGMTLSALVLGIAKLAEGYPSESVERQEAIRSWLASFVTQTHENDLPQLIATFPSGGGTPEVPPIHLRPVATVPAQAEQTPQQPPGPITGPTGADSSPTPPANEAPAPQQEPEQVPQHLPDPASKPTESSFAFHHPIAAVAIGSVIRGSDNISTVAVRFATQLGLDENREHLGSEVNAYRHAVWQAMIAARFGADVAREAGFAHEDVLPPNLEQREFSGDGALQNADATADLVNNIIGRNIAQQNLGATPHALAV